MGILIRSLYPVEAQWSERTWGRTLQRKLNARPCFTDDTSAQLFLAL